MKTRFPSEILSVLGLVVSIAAIGAVAFFDVSELAEAALGLIGIPLAGAVLVIVMDWIAEWKRTEVTPVTVRPVAVERKAAVPGRLPKRAALVRPAVALPRQSAYQEVTRVA